ncbi:hypothetical protein GGI12_000684 [Dipsacomyces acuminosporus]|nr:hypothetical protein GGI12_000684 [Dipsacomyces acuminosporus]
MEVDEWLQILAQHPIFEATGAKINSSSSSSSSSNDGGAMLPRERLAIRGTDLFVAVGQEVRWINLKACKDAYVRFESKQVGLKGSSSGEKSTSAKQSLKTKQEAVKSVPWFKLCCEALSFDIYKLVCNSTGKLLAAVGSHQVAVVVLPAPSAAGKHAAMTAGGFLMASSGGGAFNAARLDRPTGEHPEEGVWLDCRSVLLGSMQTATNAKEKRRTSAAGSSLSVSAPWSVRTRIQDALWHQLSSTDSHLLVLHANGTVRLFDVSSDVDVPEQTFSLRNAKGGSSGFSMSQAAAFCMGSSAAAGWARTTLYVLTNTGEVYSLCPVLPRACCIERDWLEDLLETTELVVREWQAEEYETSECIYTPPELAAARAATKWINQVLSLDKAKTAAPGGERLYLTLPGNLSLPPCTQGPYLFQPEPAPVDGSGYDSDDSISSGASDKSMGANAEDASDILYIESGSGVGLIAVAYCDAHVEVFADLEPVIARWSSHSSRNPRPEELPVLVTLASIDLAVTPLTSESSRGSSGLTFSSQKARQIGSVSVVGDTMNPYVFFAMHPCGVHRVDASKWMRLLDAALGLGTEDERSAALERLLFVLDGRTAESTAAPGMDENRRGTLLRNCVQCIVHTNPCSAGEGIPVVGIAVIDDVYLSYSLLALASPNQLVGVALPLSSPSDDEAAYNEDGGGEEKGEESGEGRGPRRLDLSQSSKNVIYVPRLPMPVYEVPSTLGANGSLAVQQPRLVLRSDSSNEGITEEKLKLLGEVVGQLRGQLAAIATAHSTMESRLDLQVQEFERQHNKLADVSTGFSKHFEHMKTMQKRIDGLRANGRKLSVRVDQMLRQLIDHYQPELTASERAFVREVGSMTARVDGVGGYREQVDVLEEKVDELKTMTRSNERQAKRSGGADAPQLSKTALKSIGQALDREQGHLKDTCNRIKDMQKRLDQISLRQQQRIEQS